MLLSEPKKREYRPRKQPTPAAHSADRVPPQALDAERTILGSMLIDGTAVDIALESLSDDNFYSEAHSKIFICMRELSERSTPVDLITISEKLRQKEWMEDIGTEVYLTELAENVATAGNIQHYAQIVKEKSTLRQLIHASGEITTDCFSSESEAQEILDAAEAKIFAISESRIKNKVESIGQLLPAAFKEIESYKAGGGVVGVPSGFDELDEMTTGFHKGDLAIVGARPSMGKTAFCLAIAQHAAVRAGYSTVVFSLEMSKSQIVQRLLCSEARVNMHSLRRGTLPKHEYPKLNMHAGPLAQSPLYIDDTPGLSVLELRSKARRLKSQYNLGLIIVDYLQLMTPSVKTENVQQDTAQISRSLKSIAKELELPVLALSQLSRATVQRGEKHRRPQLSDLRDSGAIEQDADVVLFIHREDYYKDMDGNDGNISLGNNDDGEEAEIIIGKQRNGPTGVVKVAFVKKYAKFENLSARADSGIPRREPDDAGA
ncbi:MAG: replicative DNA helicase [Chitinispirillales bacterium]|jgi:replicative DNA helicase|nr:replicative DNA helicase [Chitinispirillales bacterium]